MYPTPPAFSPPHTYTPHLPHTHTHTSPLHIKQLFTHRADVDALNKAQLEELPGDPVVFRAQDEGQLDVLRTGCPASQLLNLKVGAQVMLLVNMSMKKGLVNGAR